MNKQEQKKTIANNLSRLINESGKSQKEIAKAIGESPQVLNSWVKAVSIPGIWKVEKLAHYFGVPKSYIVDEQTDISLTKELADLLNIIRRDTLLQDGIKTYITLSDEKKRYILNLIHLLADE